LAEEGDAVAVGAVVCLIDTEGAKPEGSDKSEGSTAEVAPAAPVAEAKSAAAPPDSSSSYSGCDICFGTPPAARKRKNINYLG
jgi:2-oxoglutarate dehydrogenase E2 component (dihydrolipoamide succinyltransferase)